MGFTAVAVQLIASSADTVEMGSSMTLRASSVMMVGKSTVHPEVTVQRLANGKPSRANAVAVRLLSYIPIDPRLIRAQALPETPLVPQRLNAKRIARPVALRRLHVKLATPSQ